MVCFGHAPAFVHQNVFFTLAFAVAAFLPWQRVRPGMAVCLSVLCMGAAAQFIHADYGFPGVCLIGAMAVAYGNLAAMMPCIGCFFFLKTGWLVPGLLQRFAVSAAMALLWAWVIGMDDGRPGDRKWRKWFYIAYPAHLAILWCLRMWLGA